MKNGSRTPCMYHKKKVVSSQKNVYFIKEYLCTNYGTFKLFMFYPYIILIKIALFWQNDKCGFFNYNDWHPFLINHQKASNIEEWILHANGTSKIEKRPKVLYEIVWPCNSKLGNWLRNLQLTVNGSRFLKWKKK